MRFEEQRVSELVAVDEEEGGEGHMRVEFACGVRFEDGGGREAEAEGGVQARGVEEFRVVDEVRVGVGVVARGGLETRWFLV